MKQSTAHNIYFFSNECSVNARQRRKRIGSVVVTLREEPIGIFTERDLLTTFLARGRPLSVTVGEVCSSPLLAIPAGTPVNVAAHVNASKHVKRLPVVEDDEMVGIITARDLVEAYAK